MLTHRSRARSRGERRRARVTRAVPEVRLVLRHDTGRFECDTFETSGTTSKATDAMRDARMVRIFVMKETMI
jgi:hypothetical protein